MKIGVTTYPTGLQSKGGLEVHIRETIAALKALGVDVEIVDLPSARLTDYDLIHQFCLDHSSFRVLQKARLFGIPTVVTPMLEPITSRARIAKIQIVRKVMHRLFGTEFRSRWDDAVDGLEAADAILPLTPVERDLIATLRPDVMERVTVVPNGVSELFFDFSAEADTEARSEPSGFVLQASSIVPYKNQLAVIGVARQLGYPVVLAGPILDDGYFAQCMATGGDGVSYVGELEPRSRELAALYARAGLVVLASTAEPFGLVPFEALAVGVPAALTTASGVDTPAVEPYFQRVDPRSDACIRRVLKTGMEAPRDPAACRAIADPLRWSAVAEQVRQVYESVLAKAG